MESEYNLIEQFKTQFKSSIKIMIEINKETNLIIYIEISVVKVHCCFAIGMKK